MITEMIEEPQTLEEWFKKYGYSGLLSAAGAFGVALQNYQAVELALKATKWSAGLIQAVALSAGGACSGIVNFWMNLDLLDGFFKRMNADKDYQYKKLTPWQQVQYFGGIFVFSVTGLLFGLTAFAFAMTGPLAILSVAVGVFVAAIMTIQEIETWLASYDEKEVTEAESLTMLQQVGKWCGHLIALGNVMALSLLFTLSLAEALMALQVAAIPALIAGFAVSFTFGAFTEYYFYNFYLADFCKDFGDNLYAMMEAPYALIGFLSVSTNAFVNAALTYSALELLTVLLIAAEVVLPPAAIITAISLASAFFAGAASFVLGMDFWIGDKAAKEPDIKPENTGVSVATSGYSLFAFNDRKGMQVTEDAPIARVVVSV